MKVSEARDLVVGLISQETVADGLLAGLLSPESPDGDEGKFVLDGKAARAIHHYDGWYVPINLDWFHGSFDPPTVNRGAFHWYVFAIPARTQWRRDHYFVCDYLQLRDWMLAFTAPLGRDHRDHKHWRADLRRLADDPDETSGYFRWADEPIGTILPERVFQLGNASTIRELALIAPGKRVGVFGPVGESAAHRRLKLYVAAHPEQIGLARAALPHVEYRFATGDRVDVMFDNHRPHRTVVEVEVSGEMNLVVGIQQAVKYRSLAEFDGDFGPGSASVHSTVVAYEVDYPNARRFADRYDVKMIGLDPSEALALAG